MSSAEVDLVKLLVLSMNTAGLCSIPFQLHACIYVASFAYMKCMVLNVVVKLLLEECGNIVLYYTVKQANQIASNA